MLEKLQDLEWNLAIVVGRRVVKDVVLFFDDCRSLGG